MAAMTVRTGRVPEMAVGGRPPGAGAETDEAVAR